MIDRADFLVPGGADASEGIRVEFIAELVGF